ncbi:hypothetical protein MSAN_01840900 [Mycena sanguinolenta]|uniref:Uncharacterized protein n=1 Tax=Mycena sanguinolenta TaxID=230812 RepID=A0A8H6XT70_9AGAR|nr:hypothetical protein MSAN_01840900 [Mycena sanguinolenta]
MGFFFSRKFDPAEDTTSSKENARSVPNHESGFKSLRSRFLNAKKDAQDRDSPPPMFAQATSVAATLSPPPPATPIANRHLQLKLKLSSSSPTLNTNRNPSRTDRAKSANNSPTTNRRSMQSSDPDQRPTSSRSRALGTKASSSSLASSVATRKPADAVTTTLAQRLNELALANSEGLLNDDEYRLLRQDLFQRFASTTTVPTEAPVVPLASSSQNLRPRASVRANGATIPADKRQSIDSRRLSISTSSNFYVEKPRTPSVHSRTSMTSGVASFFRRATGRNSSHDYSDTSSIFTSYSKRLSKKNSASSLGTDRGDSVSISSRPTNNHLSSPTEPNNPPASIRSVRRLPTPPSSFPTRLPGVESRFAGVGSESPTEGDTESVAALRREIQAVEAEARRLMDAFNGLELTTITKRKRTALTTPRDSVATLVPEARVSFARSRRGSDAAERDGDAMSLRSATSAGTTPSMTSRRAASTHRSGGSGGLKAHGPAEELGLELREYAHGLALRDRRAQTGAKHLLSLPHVDERERQLDARQVCRGVRGTSPMGIVREDEAVLTVDLDDEREFGIEMEELRRKREEVAARYETRLEYLRAKLKGAELHEKLLSK